MVSDVSLLLPRSQARATSVSRQTQGARLRQRPDDRLVVTLGDGGELIHVLLPRLRDVVHVAGEFLLAAGGRHHQGMASVMSADIGEAVNDTPWNDHPSTWAYGFLLIADEVFYLPLDHNKELVFGRRDMSGRTETRRDSHV